MGRRITCCTSIDRFVDLSDIHEHLKPFYSETGRFSIDPELMIRMLIIGYCMIKKGLNVGERKCSGFEGV